MVRKKLATAILAISAMQAGWVSALGLGEATLKSSLNQPLVAEIYINDLGDLSADQLVVKMASAEDFNRAGVERAFFLSGIKFDVRMDGRGGGVVRLVTREPVNEPYLNFVIEARWPSGRMLREYTLLLDLPVFSQGGTGAIDSASTSAVGAAIELADQAPETAVYNQPRRVARPSAASTYTPAGDGQHRVAENETLWRIASNNRPQGATVQQTVVAIHRMNPEAFANGNMNLLKSGAVLRLPTAADVEAIGDGDAAVEISQARSAAQESAPVERGPDLDARATEEAAPAAASETSRLSIATPGESAGEGSADAEASKALRDQLGAAQENLDRVQREKAELEGRVDDMERQMGTLQKILQLKEEQLAALQAQGGTAPAESTAQSTEQPAPEQPATEQPTPEQPAAEQPAQAAAEPATEPASATSEPVAESPAPAATTESQSPAKPAPATPAAQPGLVDQLLDNSIALIGIVVAGFAAIAVMASRRRKQAAEEREVENLLAQEDFAADMPAVEAALATASASAAREEFTSPEAAPAAAEVAAPKTTAETGDPIAEADIYVAYGRYPQAIDLLQGAIRNEPARSDYQVKLLEVYLETQDKAGFRAQFAQLKALGDATAVDRVKELMSAFDGVEGWLDNAELIQDEEIALDHEIADEALLAKGSDDVRSSEFAAATDELPHDDSELTLDLDSDIDSELAADIAEAGDAGLNLDLSDFTTDSAASAELNDELTLDESFDAAEDFSANLSLDDELTGAEIAEAEESALLAEAELPEEFLAQDETPSFDNGFADDLEKSLQAEDDSLSLDGDIGELDDIDQALSELGSDTDLASLDNEFAGLLDEAPLADDLPLEMPADLAADLSADLDTELPETLDFAANEEVSLAEVAAEESLAEIALDSDAGEESLDADLDLSDLGDLDSGMDLSALETAPVAEETAVATPASSESADEFDFADSDEVATKLDLARAYIDMGDTDGAKEILDEVLAEGNDDQKNQASELMARIA